MTSNTPVLPSTKGTPCFLALDLEFNQPSRRLIEVGVCLGHPELPRSQWVTRSWLLNPHEALSPEVSRLTGITEEAIASKGVTYEVFVQELRALIDANKPFILPVTWGDGDARALIEALSEKSLSLAYFGKRCIDVKGVTSFLAMAHPTGARGTNGGLSSIMGRYKLSFEGRAHRADIDAFNTLRLYFAVLERQRIIEASIADLRGI